MRALEVLIQRMLSLEAIQMCPGQASNYLPMAAVEELVQFLIAPLALVAVAAVRAPLV